PCRLPRLEAGDVRADVGEPVAGGVTRAGVADRDRADAGRPHVAEVAPGDADDLRGRLGGDDRVERALGDEVADNLGVGDADLDLDVERLRGDLVGPRVEARRGSAGVSRHSG